MTNIPDSLSVVEGSADLGTPPRISARRLPLLAGEFRRDRVGATVIEFAILVVPFLMFVLMIFQIALYHFGLQSLDYATRLGAREIMLGRVAADAQTKAGFKAKIICPKFLMGFTCGDVVINATKIPASVAQGPGPSLAQFVDTGDLKLKPVSPGGFCLGGPGDYVFLDVSYVFPNFVGALFAGTGITSNTFTLRSTSFFRNEPYKGIAAAC